MTRWFLAMFGSLALCSQVVRGAEFVFVNLDGPFEGLNDPTPAFPVGGNTGLTVGSQRLAALERVGQIWGRYLVSSVPIRVEVVFDPLGASTLAAAGPVTTEMNFSNAPLPGTLYTVAHANSLAGRDLRPTRNDITVTVNSNADFYLGFNQDADAGGSNFIDTLLHEVGHGLGFISFVNEATGSYPQGLPDAFTALIFDISRNARWTALSPSQRMASAVSGANLVWDGPFTTAGANQVLDLASGQRPFAVDAVLPDLTRNLDVVYSEVSFGTRLPGKGISAPLVVTDDGSGATSTLACQDIVNGAEVSGNIAFIRRGECNFDDKAFRAQQVGAVAVVIANNVDGGVIAAGGDSIVEDEVVEFTVPVVFIGKADGDLLEAASPGVRLEISQRQGARAGGNSGRVNLFAPNPVQSGSSVSHWTTAATPDLLMEPLINQNLDRRMDLTLTQMKDIGWQVIDIPFPNDSYATWAAQVFDAGETLIAETDDVDGDGASNLEEYFFGSDPEDGSSRRFPEFVMEDGDPRLEIVVSKLPSDLLFTLEISETLEGFENAVPGVDVRMLPPENNGMDSERLAFEVVSPPARFFARLRIVKKDL